MINPKGFSTILTAIVLLYSLKTHSNTMVVIGAEDDWAPYSFINQEKLTIDGITPKLVAAIFMEEGVDVIFRPLPYARCMQYAMTGEILACFNTSVTDDNRSLYYWHNPPLYEEELAIFALSSQTRRDLSMKDLAGFKVGLTIGYDYPTILMKNPLIYKHQVKSDSQLLNMLVRKRVDFILMAIRPGLFKIKMEKMIGKIVQVGTISHNGVWVVFSKNHPQGAVMKSIFERGMKKLIESGRYDALIKEEENRLGMH